LCSNATSSKVLLYESFLLLSELPLDSLTTLQASSDHPFTHYIRHWLTAASSANPANDQYVFMSCLERMDPSLWAGVSPVSPMALEESEVERVMMLLESVDGVIRRKVSILVDRSLFRSQRRLF
jgi:AP-4 complex subunit epsilon-1